jgi:hypothetical protein
MLIALCSDKGSPGVTTTALALGSAWPTPVVVVEVDLSGGDLAIRLRPRGAALPEAPTLLTVATAARAHSEPDLVRRHAHGLNAHVAVVPAPIGHEQLSGVGDWRPLLDALVNSDVPVLADLGRLGADSPVWDIAIHADLVTLVGRPEPHSVIRMRDKISRMARGISAARGRPARLFPILVTPRRHGQANVRDLLAVLSDTPGGPFLAGGGCMALDPGAVRRLEAGEEPSGRLARTDLLRSARALAATVYGAAQSEPGGATTRVGERHA